MQADRTVRAIPRTERSSHRRRRRRARTVPAPLDRPVATRRTALQRAALLKRRPSSIASLKTLTTLVPSDAETKKNGSFFFAGKLNVFCVTDMSTAQRHGAWQRRGTDRHAAMRHGVRHKIGSRLPRKI